MLAHAKFHYKNSPNKNICRFLQSKQSDPGRKVMCKEWWKQRQEGKRENWKQQEKLFQSILRYTQMQ